MIDFYQITEQLGYQDAGLLLTEEYDKHYEGYLHYRNNVYELIEKGVKGATYEELCELA